MSEEQGECRPDDRRGYTIADLIRIRDDAAPMRSYIFPYYESQDHTGDDT